MLHHNFRIIFRNFKRYKTSFFINLIGLSSGMAFAILILLWAQNEISYDHFNAFADRIYRITSEIRGERVSLTCYPLADAIKTEIPEE